MSAPALPLPSMIDVLHLEAPPNEAAVRHALKILIWSSIPTHHQAAFLSALRRQGIDVVVHYLSHVPLARQQLGWQVPTELQAYERYVAANIASVRDCADWRTRIHVIPGCGSPFMFALAAFLSASNVRWVNWSEPSDPRNSAQVFKNALRKLYAMLNNAFGLGSLAIGTLAAIDFLRWGIRPDRVLYLPYSIAPVPLPALSVDYPPQTPRTRFLFLGVFCERKGIDVLLRAFAILRAADGHAVLTLVGRDDSNGAYSELARLLEISDSVDFCASVDAAQIGNVLAQCDVFVLPSRFDGWGMALSEAASAGKALIATKACGAAYHLIEEGVNGYRVPPDDATALAEKMLRYCRVPGLAAAHGAGSAILFADLAPDRNAVRMIRSLEKLILLQK